ncbi:GNAT family N-acetyltransferase [Alkalicella caledoniensis]|uniref:GNAT family N-acetyltransferase n=1 Tax=Alkalicella caledoniensis TaxID=2731377 RepID=A0A7G9W669_ALKCA|nr:GNAT family N-acetyltransferase [Alkalicella caledoniensis]QNO14181.1 GNAT family N-acetyltransferase [Alkalicella caledoniensis]
MNQIYLKELNKSQINIDIFVKFNRYQEVKKCWRKQNGDWVLKDIPFTENWSMDDYNTLIEHLYRTIDAGGKVTGAFYNDELVGFASVENELFGSNKDYLQLSSLHTSYDYRGMGIGKKLFRLTCEQAKAMGAKKLYISTHSSEESQAFYKAVGCREAVEYNERLVAEEPCDCQLEYSLEAIE